MIVIPRDAPGSVACGRERPAAAGDCSNGHRRLIPFRLLKTWRDDRTPLYGRPFKCKACGSREVTLFAIDSQAELDRGPAGAGGPPQPTQAPTTHARPDPDSGFV